jgi:hypothetical protein
MTTRSYIQSYSCLIIIVLLAACGTMPAKPKVSTPTVAHIEVLPSETLNSSPTPLPTFSIPPYIDPAAVPASTPLPASLPKFPMDGYVLFFTRDGDLYFQEGNLSPIKVSHLGVRNNLRAFSRDYQKVVFYQTDGNIYSINTDGTQERIIIPKNWLNSFPSGTQLSVLNFIPNTHLLFFGTILCKDQSSTSLCSITIFLADTATGKIRKLADLGLAQEEYLLPFIPNNVKISPDGKMMAVGTTDGLKIFYMDGRIIRSNVLPYKPSTTYAIFPSLFWLPDSSGLIAALPNTIYHSQHSDDITAYTIWRYIIDSNSSVQIPFDPPVAGSLEVSPDGNWIVYGAISSSEATLYLGNLVDNRVEPFGHDVNKVFSWSPNSKHFIHGWTVVTSFDNPPVYGGAGPYWLDFDHFIYFDLKANNPTIQQDRLLIGEIRGDKIDYYDLGIPYMSFLMIGQKR